MSILYMIYPFISCKTTSLCSSHAGFLLSQKKYLEYSCLSVFALVSTGNSFSPKITLANSSTYIRYFYQCHSVCEDLIDFPTEYFTPIHSTPYPLPFKFSLIFPTSHLPIYHNILCTSSFVDFLSLL